MFAGPKRESFFNFEDVYNNNPALKIMVEDKLVEMIGDFHFNNNSQNINVDFSHLFYGNIPPLNEIQLEKVYTASEGQSLFDESDCE